MPAKEAKFHSKLFDKIDDYIENNDTKFESVTIEDNAGDGFADIYLESHKTASLVIEVKRDNKSPTTKEHIVQARDYAEKKKAELFAVCNSNDFFIYDYIEAKENSIIDAHRISKEYINLKDYSSRKPDMGGFIPRLFSTIDSMFKRDSIDSDEKNNILGELRSYHNVVWPIYSTLIEEKCSSNALIEEEFENWVEQNDYGNKDRSKQYEIAAKQYSYLLVNRILFYNVIREKVNQGKIKPDEKVILNSLYEDINPAGLKSRMKEQFERIVRKIDYEPIFEEDENSLFSYISQEVNNRKTQLLLSQLLRNLEEYEIEDIDEDFLGSLYEELIPAEERKELGQYYTPPIMARSIVNWCINQWSSSKSGAIPKILDPASGSGTFPVELYKKINQNYPMSDHMDIVSKLNYCDINRFPLHLTALNIASLNPEEKTTELKDHYGSYFETDFNSLDIVVGNPPYISSNNLYPNKDHFRNHLENAFDGKYTTRKNRLSKRSDAYIYFISKSIDEMDNGGLLGFVIPTKWMTVGYGEGIKRMLNEETKIHHIITYDSRAFDDAQVTTCLLLLEKDTSDTPENEVRFTRLFDKLDPQDLYSNIENYKMNPKEKQIDSKSLDSLRMLSVRQSDLFESPSEKIEYYARLPADIINDIIKTNNTLMLDNICEISSGTKTGANRFFIVDQDVVEEWDLSDDYLSLALTDVDDIGTKKIYMIDVNQYVSNCENEDEAKDRLRNMEYYSLVDYIEYAESNDWHTGRTCSRRDVWFNLGEISGSRPILQNGMHEKTGPVDNYENRIPKNRFYNIETDYDEDFVMALLDSLICKLSIEGIGRREGGGILELLREDWKQARIPDPDMIDDHDKVIELYNDGQEELMNKYLLQQIGIGEDNYGYYSQVFETIRDSRVGRGQDVRSLLTER